MYRVGLLGTENSHAMAFAKTLNLPDPVTGERLYPEFRVVACFAHEKAPSEAIVSVARTSSSSKALKKWWISSIVR